jgi:hypothetical protein
VQLDSPVAAWFKVGAIHVHTRHISQNQHAPIDRVI